MPELHSLPAGSRPEKAIRNNGPDRLALERYKLRELAEGWPVYRDSCDWENLQSIFHPDAYIYTSWTGRTHHLDFIAASQAGMDRGAFTMHRCHGVTTDINTDATRAVTKMKATITQRFALDGGEADAESDCRFCFFWIKTDDGEWKARFVRHWYEKLDEEKLQQYLTGYRYLAYCQEKVMGAKVLRDLPGHWKECGVPGGSKVCGDSHDVLYWQCKRWIEGEELDI